MVTSVHRTSVLPMQRRCRIALTGGPGGGKTTAAELFRRELGEVVVVVPESATILFAGGFPRAGERDAERSIQRAIFHVQRSLEDVQSARYPERVLLCDRGTVDGAAYWPNGDRDFFEAMGTSFETELQRYDAVVFFETAAVAGASIEGGNPYRKESLAEAIALDQRLRNLWSHHPRFTLVPHCPSFIHKITLGLTALQRIVEQAQLTPVPFHPAVNP
ncbi:MAG: ATP-binding protein [Myxococcota bacterium]|jgi:predicted ATPase|nr:ATP-binding protein [Myxococcota bacterium]